MASLSITALVLLLVPSFVIASSDPISPTFTNSTTRQRRLVEVCGQFCRFRLCNFNGNSFRLDKAAFYLLNPPDETLVPYICRSGTSIGRITGTLEPSVADREGLVPISEWSPPGLRKPFSPEFFYAGDISLLPWSSISRRDTLGNQWDFLHDKCFVLPITGFQIIDSDTQRLVRNERVDTSDRSNCVAFRTTAPQIHIQLTWDSPDDFDLSVTEPDGDIVNFQTPRSEQGKLNGDNNKGVCFSGLPVGKEDIVYFPSRNIETGNYRVSVSHSFKCGASSTKWTLTVSKNGVVVKRKTGTAAAGNNELVLTTIFKFP